MTAVLAVLVAIGVVRVPASDPAPGAAGVSYGHSLLRVLLTVQLDAPCREAEMRAATGADPRRGAAAAGHRAAGERRCRRGRAHPGRRPHHARTPLPQQADLTAVGDALSYGATYETDTVRIRVPTPRLADELVALLAPYQPVARTGPGRLDRPLQVWPVVASGGPLCEIGRAGQADAGACVGERRVSRMQP